MRQQHLFDHQHPKGHHTFQWWIFMLVVLGTFSLGGIFALRADPALAADSADTLRSLVGPVVVGQIEAWVFQTVDWFHKAQFQATGGASSSVQWATTPDTTGASSLAKTPMPTQANTNPSIHRSNNTGVVLQPPAPVQSPPQQVVTPAPITTLNGSPWSSFINGPDGLPTLWRTMVAPDSARPYAQAALVRIDLQRAQLHLVAGTTEPASTVHLSRPGVIPSSDQQTGKLLAAFNGRFKAISGHFGMKVNGATLLPPQNSLATLAFYRDGRIRLGVWGQDITASPDLVSFRQNCPLLVSSGALTTQAQSDEQALWGKTVGNKIATWRSGLGLSADGRFLFYAVSDNLTVNALGQALVWAGADRAMQLDINSYWTRFDTFSTTPVGEIAAQNLLTGMHGDSKLFLTPYSRDFLYVTAH